MSTRSPYIFLKGALAHKNIVVLEVEGGLDKYLGEHRKNITPVVNVIREAGWSAEVTYCRLEWKDDLCGYVSQNFSGHISHVSPGNIPSGERGCFELLTSLSVVGLIGMSTPDEMMAYGVKDALVKFGDTDLVPSDTAAYYDVRIFHSTFPTSLSYGERVSKQNRGSTGPSIWHVHIADEEVVKNVEPGTPLLLGIELKCTEAVDNHTETCELGEFMDFCDQYIIGNNGVLVDIRFMPRITESEIHILLVGPHPVFVVHKKLVEGGDALSATLFSGAKYMYNRPEEWQDLTDMFAETCPVIAENLGGNDILPIWAADSMLADGEDGEGICVPGEIDCFCVGFTSELDMGIQELVVQEAIKRIEATNK